MSKIHHAAHEARYLFDNAGIETKSRFDALSALFDAGTIRHLEARHVGEGWQCLEVGGGGGSIASWLCRRVGPLGRVVATDIDTRFLETLGLPNLDVHRHDIQSESLPVDKFDLVHARLVLMHLPNRGKALDRMVAALKPGGWIVLEEFDALSLLPDPVVSPCEVRLRTGDALREAMTAQGVDLRFGRCLHGQLRARRLLKVCAEGAVVAVPGGSAGATLIKASYEQLREALVESGIISGQEFERDLARLDQDDFLVPSPIMWTAWGQAQEAP